MKMSRELKEVFKYFAQYDYAPSLNQIHTFYPSKISKKSLTHNLNELVIRKVLVQENIGNNEVYVPLKLKKTIQTRQKRYSYSMEKYAKAQEVAKLLGKLPQIHLVGLSGSVAVTNAKKSDDIDFFIITKSGNLWTGRFLTLVILQILGVRRRFGEKIVANKICCNLFFDGRELAIPEEKRSNYTAHELLQMVPLVSKRGVYQKLMKQNDWVFTFFPNARSVMKRKIQDFPKNELWWLNKLSIIEKIFRIIQLTLINKHKTKEYITNTQLWFFKETTLRK